MSSSLRAVCARQTTRGFRVSDSGSRRFDEGVWRYALRDLPARGASSRGLNCIGTLPRRDCASLLTAQYERWWSVDVQPCVSKEHFLRYAGRYVRRPPLAQYRILDHTPDEISFRTLDHKQKREVVTRCTSGGLIDLLAEHIPDHYKHAIRHFGLLSPRIRGSSFGMLFAQLGEHRREKPRTPQLGQID